MLVLRISSMLALVLACVLLITAGIRFHDDPRAGRVQDIPPLAEKLAEARGGAANAVSPLVAQAEALAAYLNPPQSAEEPVPESATDSAPSLSSAASTAQLKLHATSYYPDQPNKSMALISDAAAAENQRWVKEGSSYGPFVVHEIRRGTIIYREGDILCEAALDQGVRPPSIVHDLRGGSRKVSAAVGDAMRSAATPVGPNDVEITGN
jgi:hypothetical protein